MRGTFRQTKGPLVTGIPVGVGAVPKSTPRRNLLLGDYGLFGSQKSGMRLTANGAGQAEVRAVPGFRIAGTSAAGFAALNRAFRERAAAHGLNVG